MPAFLGHVPRNLFGELSAPYGRDCTRGSCQLPPPPYRPPPLSFAQSPQLFVPEPQGGILLLDFLERVLADADRVAVRSALRAGAVAVNGMQCERNCRLRAGDMVTIDVDLGVLQRRPRIPDRALPVLFESEHLLVVDKPAGLPVVPDRAGAQQGVHGLLGSLRAGADLRIAHRLDRDTSGCLLLAKGLASARHLDQSFRRGLVRKDYLALVHGRMARAFETIDLHLGPDPARPGKVVASPRARAGFRTAVTEVQVEASMPDFTLVRVRPRTGRGHQIRVHLQSLGHPIVADLDYGGRRLLLSDLKPGYKRRPGTVERPLLARMFLHASAVALIDVDGAEVAVKAPLPDDLRIALAKVQAFAVRRPRRAGGSCRPESSPCA